MYHYVRPIKGSRYPEIKGLELDLFIEQLRFFQRCYTPVSMEDVLAAIHDSARLPENALLLSFDDAYSDHFEYVYPVLADMKLQGSYYVPAKTVLQHKVLDVNKVHFILASAPDVNDLVKALAGAIDSHRENHDLASFDEYYSEYAVANRFDPKEVIFIKRMLQHALPEDLRNTIVDSLFEQYVGMDEATFARELYMSEAQLGELLSGGMHIGCHGYDHYWWNKLDEDALKSELDRSEQFLSKLGCDMENWTASYPYGSYSKIGVAELEKRNCKLAFTTEVRVADLATDHPLLIPRLDTNDLPKDANVEPNSWYTG